MFKFPRVKAYSVESSVNGENQVITVVVSNNRNGVINDVQPRIAGLFDRLVGRQHFSVVTGWNRLVEDIVIDELTK